MNHDRTNAQEASYTFTEVAYHFQVTPEMLRSWIRRFAQLLSPTAKAEPPRFTSADVAALITVQKLLEQGLQDEQINAQLTPKRIVSDESAAVALSTDQARQLVEGKAALLPQALGDILSAIANSQQTVLNSQSTVRELIGVVVQDNFNLKEENRKLRERMLELERALAEYQRREETRKERLESRLRALENTVAAQQQQIAQLIQLQRQNQQKKRGWW
ncbi:MAG: MerR family transcriptional regulator [Caldilinea sp.]|nr:MerR family transcriptional regulator [Caldilinea sp.]MDW8441218.1 MerR family transcriptional regulator [Caldilineaceae bacterium]